MNTCPICGRPLAGYVQPAYANVPARRYETCWTEHCDLYAVTLESGEHQLLSDERIDEYAAVNRRLRSLP